METPKYCQIEDVSAQLMVDIAEDFIPQVETWILAMENYVEKITHRIFVAPEEAYSKFYDGNNKNHILIDECISVDSLKIDGVEIDSESYYLMPYNKTPYWKIELKQGLYFNRFTAPNFTRKNIEISAKWAYSETCPPAITEAVAILDSSAEVGKPWYGHARAQSETSSQVPTFFYSNGWLAAYFQSGSPALVQP